MPASSTSRRSSSSSGTSMYGIGRPVARGQQLRAGDYVVATIFTTIGQDDRAGTGDVIRRDVGNFPFAGRGHNPADLFDPRDHRKQARLEYRRWRQERPLQSGLADRLDARIMEAAQRVAVMLDRAVQLDDP